jgi:hypothetical protein
MLSVCTKHAICTQFEAISPESIRIFLLAAGELASTRKFAVRDWPADLLCSHLAFRVRGIEMAWKMRETHAIEVFSKAVFHPGSSSLDSAVLVNDWEEVAQHSSNERAVSLLSDYFTDCALLSSCTAISAYASCRDVLMLCN